MVEQPSTSTEACSVDEQDGVIWRAFRRLFRHETNSSSPESRGAYFSEYAELFLRLSRGERPRLLDDLLSIFQCADLDFSNFREVCEPQKRCYQILSRRIDGDDVMQAFCKSVLTWTQLVENVGQYCKEEYNGNNTDGSFAVVQQRGYVLFLSQWRGSYLSSCELQVD